MKSNLNIQTVTIINVTMPIFKVVLNSSRLFFVNFETFFEHSTPCWIVRLINGVESWKSSEKTI